MGECVLIWRMEAVKTETSKSIMADPEEVDGKMVSMGE